MELTACLGATTWRMLVAIARTWRLPVDSRTAKAQLVETLAAFLPRRVRRPDVLQSLDPVARSALACLAVARGGVPVAEFAQAFGALRPLAAGGAADPRRRARDPQSAAERLLYRGLVFVVSEPRAARGRPAAGLGRVVLPAEWVALFRPADPACAPLAPVGTDAAAAGNIVEVSLALAVFLAVLQADPPVPLAGCWLPPSRVRGLAALLRLPAPASAGERACPPIAFLHYLAESLGLVGITGGRLTPTPGAPAWLARPRAEQLRDAWGAALPDAPAAIARWSAFRLPGSHLRRPGAFVRGVIDRLAARAAAARSRPGPSNGWFDVETFTAPGLATRLTGVGNDASGDLGDLLPWWESERRPEQIRDQVWGLLSGPLTWLGAVEVAARPARLCRVTPGGAWLLGHGEPPAEVPTAPLCLGDGPISLGDGLAIDAPSVPSLPGVLALADWATPVPVPVGDPATLRFRLSPAGMGRALSRGAEVADLLALLGRETGRPVPPDVRERLERWAAPVLPFTIRPAWLLRAPTAGHLDRLLARRALRRHFGRRLADDLVELEPAHLPGLCRDLRRLRVPFRADPGAEGPGALTPAGGPPSRGDAAWLLAALEAYTQVARRLQVPPPPAALAEAVAAQLDDAGRAGARSAAGHAARLLDRALADLEPLLQPLPVEPLLDHLQRAIDEERQLAVTYWTPGRPAPLTRRLQPRRLEWRGDTPYLVAYCQLRLAERTFRLDRILELDDAL
jgi:hypothetical protein